MKAMLLFFMAIILKRTPLCKDILLINSTIHTFTNNCVAYLADICDIFIPYRVGFLIIYHFLQINVPIGYKFSLVKSSVLKINVKKIKKIVDN